MQAGGVVQLKSDVVQHREENGKNSDSVQLRSDIAGKQSLDVDAGTYPMESSDGLRDLVEGFKWVLSFALGDAGELSAPHGPTGLLVVRQPSVNHVWGSVRQWLWAWRL